MISLTAFLRRMRGHPLRNPQPESDDDQLRRLHRRLICALGEHDPKELVDLIAEDVQLRLERKVYEGRSNMLVALGIWLDLAQITASTAHLRWLTADVALTTAQWIFDSPERGHFAEQISCLCVRREGRWWVAQIRQEANLAA